MKAHSFLCTANNRMCVGCCIRYDGNTKHVQDDLRASTTAYKQLTPGEFGSRTKAYVLPSGLCPNLVRIGRKVMCGVHPHMHQGEDYRPQYPQCYQEYLCETAKAFNTWTAKQQSAFLAYLGRQRSGWYHYGKNMDSGVWLSGFRKRSQV